MTDIAFAWLEATPLSIWLRESTSVLAYPAILSAHAIGMGLAAGVNAAIGLRVLGFAPGVPPAELRRLVPLMWSGFAVNAASGVALLLAYPTKALTNPLFYVKMSLITLSLWLFARLSRQIFGGARPANGALPRHTRLLAMLSLASWAAAITSGRLLAYTYTRLLADW